MGSTKALGFTTGSWKLVEALSDGLVVVQRISGLVGFASCLAAAEISLVMESWPRLLGQGPAKRSLCLALRWGELQ